MTGSSDERRGSRRKKSARLATLIGLVLAVAASATVVGAGNVTRQTVLPVDVHNTTSFWTRAAKPVATPGRTVAVHAARFRSLTLDTAALSSVLALAPAENTLRAETSPLVVSLPAPNGSFQRFALQESAIMSPGLAARHPGIKTYSGPGVTDPSATIHADLSPLGFHASVRSANGAWYIDPYYVGRTPSRVRELLRARREEHESARSSSAQPIPTRLSPPPKRTLAIGEQLRTYRLALITDPGYADLPRRPAERDSGEGRAHEPGQPVVRGRPRHPPAARREQRPAQPRHMGPGDGAERAVRGRGVLHAVPGHRLHEHRPGPAT